MGLKVLFDIGHPSHVFIARSLQTICKAKGYKFFVVTRNRGIVVKLLEHFNLPFTIISQPGSGFLGLLTEMIERLWKLYLLQRREKFDVIIGSTVTVGQISLISPIRSIMITEDDDAVVPLNVVLGYTAATKIFHPEVVQFKFFKQKRTLYASSQKMCYLHPKHFRPDAGVLDKYKLKAKNFVVLRKSRLNAHHDVGISGLDNIWNDLLQFLAQENKLVSIEGNEDIDPWDMHHLLAHAKYLISDSQSMTVEAAMLGVPSIRYSSFVGKIELLNQLENKYQLTIGLKPETSSLKEVVDQIHRIESVEYRRQFQIHHTQILKDMIDPIPKLLSLLEEICNV